jgi:hypothetical protein
LNVQPGGRYTIVFHTQDGEQHHLSGVYKESCPTRNSLHGRGAARRSASPTSPS